MARKARRIAKVKVKPKYRRADTGEYTTPAYARRHPRTTVKESK